MIPGVPFMAIGRNRYIAWGGTNLHAHMSELCNASAIPTSSWETREEIVTPRWSRPRRFKIRSCALGPILSDSEFYDLAGAPLALRWVGHQASDEYTAMLAVGRARNWNEFRSALADFAVPGLNMIYADTEGNAGHALAAWIPKETPAAPQDVINHDAQRSWSGFFNATELPARFKPDCGFVVSANDRPDSDVVVGHLFSSRDRVDRMTQLLNVGAVGRGALAALQADVQVDAAQKLARRLAGAARSGRSSRPTTKCERVLKELETWDGGYTADSRGAAAFELMLHAFARAFHTPESLAAYDVSWAMRDLIRADVEDGEPAKVAAAAQRALRWTSRRLGSRSWGDLHRLKLNHPLAAIPLAGRCYRFFDLPSAGGSDTLMKAANGLAKGRHAVRYGANARHISDLSDADKNDFVILGGQDGWFGSTTFADQVPLWRRNAYIQMPLRVETVPRMFPHVTTLVPRKRSGT
jgi:penicillin amidase